MDLIIVRYLQAFGTGTVRRNTGRLLLRSLHRTSSGRDGGNEADADRFGVSSLTWIRPSRHQTEQHTHLILRHIKDSRLWLLQIGQ